MVSLSLPKYGNLSGTSIFCVVELLCNIQSSVFFFKLPCLSHVPFIYLSQNIFSVKWICVFGKYIVLNSFKFLLSDSTKKIFVKSKLVSLKYSYLQFLR